MTPIDVVVTTCSHRKNELPGRIATPASLARGHQDGVAADWTARVRKLPLSGPAGNFYAGRGFSLAKKAATESRARLYILSAGLGLVPSSRPIPAYGLTVSAGHDHSVARKISGEFDPAAWFEKLLVGKYSDGWVDVAGRKSGRILLALSRPYAEMAGKTLGRVPRKMHGRLRIFGASLKNVLPAELHASIAPYDERLNAIMPGTRSDFAQRAMLHFARSLAVKPAQGREDDFTAVRAALRDLKYPEHVNRPRLSDAELLAIIKKRLRVQSGAVRILAALRHEEGVACEQTRFGRLYRMAAGKGETS